MVYSDTGTLKMKKPEPRKIERLDYSECEEYIAWKLGIKNLRNVAGKSYDPKSPDYKKPYQDFWHFIVNYYDVHNGSTFTIFSEMLENAKDWQKTIIQAFIDEFGDNAEYWVEW